MKCEEIKNLFAEALYDELDTGNKNEFDEHLTACENCRGEYAELRRTLRMMDQRTRVEPTGEEWKDFVERLEEKIGSGDKAGAGTDAGKPGIVTGDEQFVDYPIAADDLPGRSRSRRPRIIGWIPSFRPVWGYGIAAAFLLAIGFFMGRLVFLGDGTNGGNGTPEFTQMGPDNQTGMTETPAGNQGGATGTQGTPEETRSSLPGKSRSPAPTASSAQPVEATTREALDYLERSRNLLIGVTNLDESQSASLDLRRHQEVSRELYNKGNTLTVSLSRPSQQQLRQLVQQLQIILLQLSNAGVGDGRPAVEIVRQGIDSKSIIFKINLEAIRASLNERVAYNDAG